MERSNFILSYDALNYWTYNGNKNIFEHGNETTGFCYISKIATDSTGKITSFAPKTVFHALDYNDKSTISGWSMPSSRYIDLTLGASGSKYTAPANGILTLRGRTTTDNKAYGIINNASLCTNLIRVDNVGNEFGVFMLAQKGQSLTVIYEGSLASGYIFRFIYAEGEN